MAVETGDPACLSALTQELGHEPPFTEEEFGEIESLTATGAKDLSALEACVGLRHLRIIGSEVDDFYFCAMVPELEHLEVIASKVGSLSAATFCRKLERVDLLYTSVTDAMTRGDDGERRGRTSR